MLGVKYTKAVTSRLMIYSFIDLFLMILSIFMVSEMGKQVHRETWAISDFTAGLWLLADSPNGLIFCLPSEHNSQTDRSDESLVPGDILRHLYTLTLYLQHYV